MTQYIERSQPPVVQIIQPAPPSAPTPAPQRNESAPPVWPPPGYALVPVGQLNLAQRDALYDELHRTESRLDALRAEEPRLGASIAFMAIGYGGTLIASAIALSAFAAAEDIEHDRWQLKSDEVDYDINGDGRVNQRDERILRRTAYGFTATAGVALLTGIISNIRLVSHIDERKRVRRERILLTERRGRIRRQLDYGAYAGGQQFSLSLYGRY